jgi:hypothetical protein
VGSCNFKLQYINSIFSHALFTATHPVAEEFFQKAKLLNQYLGLYWHNILTFSAGNTIISSAEATTHVINKSPAHSVLFDESLNERLQNKQFDEYVCYWSNECCHMESCYLTSLFIGYGKTADLLNHYDEATKDLDPSSIWHIGMDGPNVNLAFEKR